MGPPAEALSGRWWAERSGRIAALSVLTVAAVAWIVMLSRPMAAMPGMGGAAMSGDMPGMAMDTPAALPSASWAEGVSFVAAWALMMAAMMLPSAVPMIALFGTISRTREPTAVGRLPLFVLPYAVLWTLTGIPVYAAAVLVARWGSEYVWWHHAAPYLVAGVLVAAGGYQLSRLKMVCLSRCQSPLGYLAHHWRRGAAGAVRLGSAHATYCFGCCIWLMIVLVAAGSMGLVWVLGIAAIVLAEKVLPPSYGAAKVTAGVLIALGVLIAGDPGLASTLRS